MGIRMLWPWAPRCVILLAAGLLAGCGETATVGLSSRASEAITRTQAVAYAHAVNLHAGDVPGFADSGSETEAPNPGRLALEEIRCSGAVSPARRIAQMESTELVSEIKRASFGKIMKSTVDVWPTPALVAANNSPSRASRARACFVRFLKALHEQINRRRRGRMQIGPFTIATVRNPLPGVGHGFLTTIDETRLVRTRAVRAHVYRDILGFTTGPAEIELEAIGVGHPVPAPTEKKALLLLLARARANAI